MSDLRPIGPAVVALAATLATPDQLQIEHDRILGTFKEDHDAEGAMLRFAHLAAVGIQSLRHMGESHAERPADRPTRDLGPHPGVARRAGGGWVARAAESPETSLRPH